MSARSLLTTLALASASITLPAAAQTPDAKTQTRPFTVMGGKQDLVQIGNSVQHPSEVTINGTAKENPDTTFTLYCGLTAENKYNFSYGRLRVVNLPDKKFGDYQIVGNSIITAVIDPLRRTPDNGPKLLVQAYNLGKVSVKSCDMDENAEPANCSPVDKPVLSTDQMRAERGNIMNECFHRMADIFPQLHMPTNNMEIAFRNDQRAIFDAKLKRKLDMLTAK